MEQPLEEYRLRVGHEESVDEVKEAGKLGEGNGVSQSAGGLGAGERIRDGRDAGEIPGPIT
jgi:hypothetical protein